MLLNLYAPPNSSKPTPPPLLFFTSDWKTILINHLGLQKFVLTDPEWLFTN